MRTTKEQRAEFIRLWKESGLSRIRFCQENDLPYATFSSWVRKSAASSRHNDEHHYMLPVNIIDDISSLNKKCSSLVTLHFRSFTLEITPGFPASELKNIIFMLGDLCS